MEMFYPTQTPSPNSADVFYRDQDRPSTVRGNHDYRAFMGDFGSPRARRDEAETELIHAFILSCKFGPPSDTSYDDADEDMDSSLKTSPRKPAKGTDAFYKQVLHPRGINIGPDNCDPRTTEYIQSKPIDKKALGRAFVSFNPKELVKSSQAAIEAAYNEAQWTINVYHPYFLLSNRNFEGGVRRQPQHPLFWRGTKQNICLPLPIVFDRRSSDLAPCTKMWEYQLSRLLTDRKQHSENCAFLDHAYFIVMPNFGDPVIRRFGSLPAYRQAMIYKKMPISCPPHFITEEKSSPDDDRAAHTYLALVSSGLLQERLLLRYVTDEAQSVGQFPWDETLCVYLMANCGSQSTVSRMKVRPANEDLKKAGASVRFDLEKLCILDTTIPSDCEELRSWVNYINDWGIKVYQPALLAEGRKARGSDYCNGENTSQRRLEMVTFHYTATGAISFSRQGGEGNDPQDLQSTHDRQPSYVQSTIASRFKSPKASVTPMPSTNRPPLDPISNNRDGATNRSPRPVARLQASKIPGQRSASSSSIAATRKSQAANTRGQHSATLSSTTVAKKSQGANTRGSHSTAPSSIAAATRSKIKPRDQAE